MSVRHGLLALLSRGPSYGARLRSDFEDGTGGSWPLNVGQVYTTLGRLERDGLVEPDSGPDDEGRIRYRITPAGRAELEAWWAAPVPREVTPRDELAIKLALAVTTPGADVATVVRRQRAATLAQIRTLTRRKAALASVLDSAPPDHRRDDEREHRHDVADTADIADIDGDDAAGGGRPDRREVLARLLVVENLIHAAEAEASWLDHVESRVRHDLSPRPPAAGGVSRGTPRS